MYDGDTLWYHAPFAARFVQSGWTTRLHFTHGEPLVTFFPANAELAAAVGVLATGRDVLTPLVNLGWLGLALLAGWCAGRPSGTSPLTLTATTVVLALPIVAATQAGTGRNDVAGLALLLAAVALLLNASTERPAVVLAGVAAGLALGVKVSMLAPVAVLTLAVLWAMPRLAATSFLPAVIVAGAPWYLRNLVRTGNPLPWFDVGPLPAPPLPEAEISGSTVLSVLGRDGIWGEVFHPGLDTSFGPLWVVVLVLSLAGAVLSFRSGDRVVRALALLSVVSGALYTVTPNTAAGAGSTTALLRGMFFLNLRYLLPALVVGLVLLPISAPARLRRPLGFVLAGTVLLTQLPRTFEADWEFRVTRSDALVGVLVAAGMLLVVTRRRAAVAAVLAVALGFAVQRGTLERRYTVDDDIPLPVAALYGQASRWEDERITTTGDFFSYPFYGPDLSNRVQFAGVRGPHGAFRAVESCDELDGAVERHGSTLVVTAQQPFQGSDAVDLARRCLGDDDPVVRVSGGA
jgi:hypothetical protein